MSVCTDEARARDNGPLSRIVMDYIDTMRDLFQRSKQPGFTRDAWKALTRFVAVDEFERVGSYKETTGWEGYVDLLDQWAPMSHWNRDFRGINELDGVVFLELEEFSEVGGSKSAVYSCTVYKFNADNKLAHLDIYLREAIQDKAMAGTWTGEAVAAE